MDHDAIREKLSAYLDGAVSPEEKLLLEKHLAECAECRETLRELARTVSRVRNLGEVEPPPWLAERIMARVREDAGRETGMLRRFLRMPLRRRVPLEAAALLFITITGYLVYRNVSSDMNQVVPLANEVRREAVSPASPPEGSSHGPVAGSAPAPKKSRAAGKDKRKTESVPSSPTDGHYSSPKFRAEAPASTVSGGTSPREEEKASDGLGMEDREIVGAVTPLADSSVAERKETGISSEMSRSKSLDMKRLELKRVELTVTDPGSAERKVERETESFGGLILRREAEKAGERVLVIRMRRNMIAGFLEHLKALGELRETPVFPQEGDAPVTLRLILRRKGM